MLPTEPVSKIAKLTI